MSNIKVHRYLNTEDQPTGFWSLHRGDPSEPIKVLTDAEVEELLRTIIRQFGDEIAIGESARKARALDWLQTNRDAIRLNHNHSDGWSIYSFYHQACSNGATLLDAVEDAMARDDKIVGLFCLRSNDAPGRRDNDGAQKYLGGAE